MGASANAGAATEAEEAEAQAMKLALLILALAMLLCGCASRRNPDNKTDASFAAGSNSIDAGTKHVRDGSLGLKITTLDDKQRVYVAQIDEGANEVEKGNGVARLAYATLSTAYENAKKPEADRMNWMVIIGAAGFALGCGLVLGGGTVPLKALGTILAVSGGTFSVWLLVLGALGPAMKLVAIGIGVIGVAGFGWFVFEKMRERKKLKDEQCATQDVVEKVPSGVLAAAMPRMSSTSQALLHKAKGKAVVKARAEMAANEDVT